MLGGEETREATLQGLKSAEGFIKMKLAKKINLRNTPEITFVMDQSIEYGVNMSHKIDEVIARDGNREGEDVDEVENGEDMTDANVDELDEE